MQSVGVAWDKYAEDADQLETLLSKEFGETPDLIKIQMLAGPNDLVQWISSAFHWKDIGLIALGYLGPKIADEVWDILKGKLVAVAKRDTPTITIDADAFFKSLIPIVNSVHAKEGDFQLRVTENPAEPAAWPITSYVDRGVYVSFPPLPPINAEVAVAKALVQMAISADEIGAGGTPSNTELETPPNPYTHLLTRRLFLKPDNDG